MGVGGGYYYYRTRAKNPDLYIHAGDQYAAAGNLPAAIDAWNFAAGLRRTDPEIHRRLGQAYWDQRDRDAQENIRLAISEWTRAAELRPDMVAAWQGLLEADLAQAMADAQRAAADGGRGMAGAGQALLPREFDAARSAADRLHQLDPSNYKARAALPLLAVNLWLLNLPIPRSPADLALPVDRQPTDGQRIDRAVADLADLMRDHPEDADLPGAIAQAKVHQGLRVLNQAEGVDAGGPNVNGRSGAPDDGAVPLTGVASPDRQARARGLFAEAAAAFDPSLRRRPTDATLNYRKFLILSTLIQMGVANPTDVAEYLRQGHEALDAAQRYVSPAEPLAFVEYRAAWAKHLGQADPAAGEAVYQDLLDHTLAVPTAGRDPVTTAPSTTASATTASATTAPAARVQLTDLQRLGFGLAVRSEYARLLERDPERHRAALAVLDPLPTVAPADLPLPVQQQVAQQLAQVRLLRANLLMDRYMDPADAADKADAARRAAAEIDGASANPNVANLYDLPMARGRLQLVQGQFRQAAQSLSAAADRLAVAKAGAIDYQLLRWEAAAYAQAGQSGQAIKLLETAIASPAGANDRLNHQALAELYLQQRDTDHARVQVGWLSERFPDDPVVLDLQLKALGPSPEPQAAAPLYARLAEDTPARVMAKADWAEKLHNPADAERLYGLALGTAPGNVGIATRLARVLAEDGQRDRANAVLDAATAANPDARGTLGLVRSQISGASVAVIRDQATVEIDKIKDPFAREVRLAKLAQTTGDLPGQIDHLAKASALHPDDADVLTSLFACRLQVGRADPKQIDEAAAMLPRITDLGSDGADQTHGLMCRTRLAIARGDKAAAVTLGRQLAGAYPQFANSWELLGEAQELAGQYELACQQFTVSLDRRANNPVALQNLVACTIRLGRLVDARHLLDEARRKYPDNPVYRDQQVAVEVQFGDPESVLPLVEQDLHDHPESPRTYQVAAPVYAAAAQQRAGRSDAAGAADFDTKERAVLDAAVTRFPGELSFAAQLASLQAQDRTAAGVSAAAATLGRVAASPQWAGKPDPDVLLGRLYLTVGQPDRAEAPLRQALAIAPASGQARGLLADCLSAQGRSDDALAVLTPTGSDAVGDDPAVRGKRVDLLLTLGRGDQAEAELNADVKAHPADVRSNDLLAHVYAVQRKYDQATAAVNRSLALDPSDAQARYLRGAMELARPQPDPAAAVADLTRFCAAAPRDLAGRSALAAALAATGDADGATRELEAAVSIAPNAKDARLRLAQLYLAVVPPRVLDARRVIVQTLAVPELAHDPDVQRVAAGVWLKAGDNDRAAAAMADAVAHAANAPALLGDYFEVLLTTGKYDQLLRECDRYANAPGVAAWAVSDYRGRAHAAAGDKEAAFADFAAALDQVGQPPGPAATAGRALLVADHATALLGLEPAVRLFDSRAASSGACRIALARCYEQAGDRDKALAAAERALSGPADLNPADRRLLVKMAGAFYITANPPQPQKAMALLESALQDQPDDVDVLNNLACLYADSVSPARPAEALADSRKAYDLCRRAGVASPAVTDTFGWCLILNDKVDDGIAVLRQVPDAARLSDAHYHLAEAYLRKGRSDDARRELDLATSLLAPDDVAIRARIAAARRRAAAA